MSQSEPPEKRKQDDLQLRKNRTKQRPSEHQQRVHAIKLNSTFKVKLLSVWVLLLRHCLVFTSTPLTPTCSLWLSLPEGANIAFLSLSAQLCCRERWDQSLDATRVNKLFSVTRLTVISYLQCILGTLNLSASLNSPCRPHLHSRKQKCYYHKGWCCTDVFQVASYKRAESDKSLSFHHFPIDQQLIDRVTWCDRKGIN